MTTNDTKRQIFDLPLSIQRYQWVQKYIESDPSIKSVTDLGCGNGRLNVWLKSITHLENINFMDCDYGLLESQIEYHFMPSFMEMLVGRQNSNKDLNIRIYCGDITVPHDLLSADCFVMVEVIEHMLLSHVQQATRAIFGYHQPKTVIITTPNSEFNHLLRQEGEESTQFRHYDHKFEWTREEFRQWAEGVCNEFPYSVRYDGVGHLPGSDPFGPCTQIAVFKQTAVGERLSRESLLIRNNDDLKEKEKRNQEIRRIGEYLVPGSTAPDQPPAFDNFDWSSCSSCVVEGATAD